MFKYMMAMLFVIFGLSGCALSPTPSGAFGTVPATSTSLTIYQCSAAKETFVHFQPQLGQVELLPFSTTVIDGGSNWIATYPDGKVQTPPLYKDLLGKIDGAVDMTTGTRYYKVKGLNAALTPTYSYSSVDPLTGTGSGMTFFRCELAPTPEDTATTIATQ